MNTNREMVSFKSKVHYQNKYTGNKIHSINNCVWNQPNSPWSENESLIEDADILQKEIISAK